MTRTIDALWVSVILLASLAFGSRTVAGPEGIGPVTVTDTSRMTWWGKWSCIGVTEINAGAEGKVTTGVGSSSETYPAKSTETLVGGHYAADGQSNTLGLHVSKVANDMVASWQGPNSFDALKAAIRSAVSGGWS